MASLIVVLCQSAASPPASFETFVVAMHSMVQRMARDCRMQSATVRTLPLSYSFVRVAPFPTCIRAASLWCLDSPKPCYIDHAFYVHSCSSLPEAECLATARNESLSATCNTGGQGDTENLLVFVPAEYRKFFAPGALEYDLFEEDRNLADIDLGAIMSSVQNGVKTAIEELVREQGGSSR